MSAPRLLSAALEPLADFRHTEGRHTRLYVELERLFPIAGFVRPALSGPADWTVKALAFHPNRDAWRGRVWLSPLAFRLRTELAERELQRWDGRYDLVFQQQTLFAPGRRSDRPYVIYTDNTYTQTERQYPAWAPLGRRASRRWRALEQETFRHARAVFGKSEWVCDAIVNDYGCDPGRVFAVGHGTNSLVPSLEGKRYDRPIALFVGNKYELKGVPTLLAAWQAVHARLPDARLRIVGVEPRGADEQSPSVEWLGYVSDWQKMEELYAQASLFVLPTQFEAFGLAVVEAMGNGLPCVVTRVGALPELVEDDAGLLVPPRDPRALADALVALLSDPARAAAMGAAGYRKVQEHLTWRVVAERMAPHLERAAAG